MTIANLARLHDAIVLAGVAITGIDANGRVNPQSLQAVAQPTIDAFDDSTAAQAAYELTRLRAEVSAAVSLSHRDAMLTRAALLVVLDEFNTHALKINAILDAVDNAATLAALKTAVAAIADYPQRTKVQLVTAMRNKINAGDTDS